MVRSDRLPGRLLEVMADPTVIRILTTKASGIRHIGAGVTYPRWTACGKFARGTQHELADVETVTCRFCRRTRLFRDIAA